MPLTFRTTHQICGLETEIVVTRLANDKSYEGYCSSCGGTVFGSLFLVSEFSKESSETLSR